MDAVEAGYIIMSYHKTDLVKGGEAKWFFFSLSALLPSSSEDVCVKPIPLPTSTAIAVAPEAPGAGSAGSNLQVC